MNPISANLSAIRNVFNIRSRARRGEYWWVLAVLASGLILAAIVDSAFFPDGGEGSAAYDWLHFAFLLFYLPYLILLVSVSIRRLHDLDMSGWYVFIYFLPLGIGLIIMCIICAKKGTPGPNRFGKNPLYIDVFSDVDEFG